jgi:type I restriction enzyme S subunit
MLDEKQITGEHLAPYLRNVDVQWGKINVEDLPEMDFKGEDVSRYSLRSGDLLVCEGGESGRAAVWRGELAECFYQKALHRLRVRSERDLAFFMFYALQAYAKLGVFTGSEGKATIAHLPAETFRRHRFAFPPCEEQSQVVSFLDGEAVRFDELIAEANRAIDLLQERRTALISAAVTGKLMCEDAKHESCR